MHAARARMLSAHEAAQYENAEDIPGYAEAAREWDFHAYMEEGNAAMQRRRADASAAALAAALRALPDISDAAGAEADPSDETEDDPTAREAEHSAHDAPQLECECRRVTCEVCNDDPLVDRMPKEARANHQRAAAGAAERRQQNLIASLDGEHGRESPISIPHAYTAHVAAAIDERDATAWTVKDGDDAPVMEVQRDAGAPPAAPVALRVFMRGCTSKKAFDKNAPERASCLFCKRRGHHRRGCPIAPSAEYQWHADITPLQERKQRWSLNLIRTARKGETAAAVWTRMGGTRLSAVQATMALGAAMNEGNPWLGSTKRRDRLRLGLGYWWAIGADAVVLSWIAFGVRLHFEAEPERCAFPNHASYEANKEYIDAEHAKHVEAGSFRRARPDECECVHPLQVEINANGKRRQCMDARYINAFIADLSFTQESLAKVAEFIQAQWVMITTDVEQAYYQVALHKTSQRYCAWRHGGEYYVPTILVFGLSIAPFIFTKIMRPVLVFMRSLSISGTNCIDDNLWAAPVEAMPEVKQIVQLVFGLLGWVFNAKCVFDAATSVVYNGMWVDTARFEIRAVDAKLELARKLAWSTWMRAREGRRVPLEDVQRLTGRLQSLKLALEGVAEWTRGLYADVARAYDRADQHPGKYHKMFLRDAALSDLHFWAHRLGRQNGLPIRDNGLEVQVTMRTDAGELGYGAHIENTTHEVEDALPLHLLGSSSTAREICGVLLATQEMVEQLKGRRVRIRMDSYPAIRNFINGGGGVPELNAMVKQWWIWCKRHRVTPLYEWIPREENTRADELSKVRAGSYELQPGVEARVRAWLTDACGVKGSGRSEWDQTTIHAPHFHHVKLRIDAMRQARVPACIIVPAWEGAMWAPQLREYTTHMLALGAAPDVIVKPETPQRWQMRACLIAPAARVTKPRH